MRFCFHPCLLKLLACWNFRGIPPKDKSMDPGNSPMTPKSSVTFSFTGLRRNHGLLNPSKRGQCHHPVSGQKNDNWTNFMVFLPVLEIWAAGLGKTPLHQQPSEVPSSHRCHLENCSGWVFAVWNLIGISHPTEAWPIHSWLNYLHVCCFSKNRQTIFEQLHTWKEPTNPTKFVVFLMGTVADYQSRRARIMIAKNWIQKCPSMCQYFTSGFTFGNWGFWSGTTSKATNENQQLRG